MPTLDRKTQRIFADGNPAQGNIAVFGSLAAGAPAFSKDPEQIQNDRYAQGWGAAVVPQDSPPLEDFNALFHLVTRQLAYIFQSGVPEWDAGTAYKLGGFCTSGGALYVSLIDDNLNNAVSVATAWGGVTQPVLAATPSVLNPATQTELRAASTAGVPDGRAALLYNPVTLTLEKWVLREGEDADDPENGVIQPDDYDADNNPKFWYLA
jgi:hypothetical protein